MLKIIGEKLNIHEFSAYLSQKNFGKTPPDSLVIHHTWKPKKEDWKGQYSISGLKNFYEKKGWPAGPHLFIADDGIWLFTDMYNVGVHAGTGNATYVHPDGRNYQGYSVPSTVKDSINFKLKGYSVGIEVVGDYDNEIWTGDTKTNSLYAIKMLQSRLNIANDKVYFHREFSPKTCPGTKITKDWLFSELNNLKFASTNAINPVNNNPNIEYKPKFDPVAVNRAITLGLLKKVDSEEREIIAISSIRVVDYLEKRMDSLESKIQSIKNNL